jgi:hypothetical protein
LQPLVANAAAATANGDSISWWLQDARFDVAATSINSYRNKMQSYLGNSSNASKPYWWDQMLDGNFNPTIALPQNAGTRFKCNPYIPKPMTADNMAQTTPYCLGGCSQFVVEYAGDYLKQDNNPSDINYGLGSTGGPPTAGSDGQIDYVVLNRNTPQQRKQILWYGLPRNTSGNATINRFNGDVVPLGVWLSASGAPPQTFEKAPYPTMTFDSNGNLTNMTAGQPYICAWGPGNGNASPQIPADVAPKLIRITLTIDDPTGRLPDGQTYQYVFAVPPQ